MMWSGYQFLTKCFCLFSPPLSAAQKHGLIWLLSEKEETECHCVLFPSGESGSSYLSTVCRNQELLISLTQNDYFHYCTVASFWKSKYMDFSFFPHLKTQPKNPVFFFLFVQFSINTNSYSCILVVCVMHHRCNITYLNFPFHVFCKKNVCQGSTNNTWIV